MRTFISIDIPEEIKGEIIKIQDKLPEFYGKKIDPENLHLTLKFLGEVNEGKIDKIKRKLGEIDFNKFETEIDSIGIFSEKFIRIVWLHLKNCDDLQSEINDKLEDLFEKEKRFMSHLTIARVKHIKNKKEFLEDLRKIEIPKIKFVVDNFRLKESVLLKEGPRYDTLGEYTLKEI